jgi:uncharacterized SAM-binding protein YcdF (DUF218 family)
MFALLSKTIFLILMPVVWMIILLAWAWKTKHDKLRKKLIVITLLLLFFFGNHAIGNWFMREWEYPALPLQETELHEQAIILTGVTIPDLLPDDRVYFAKGADRVLHTVQLYKEGKIKRILITGGNGKLIGEGKAEAPLLKKVLVLCGIPDSSIFIEAIAFNTRENALHTKALMDSLGWKGKSLLVTSAFHMRRAKGCFEKVGLIVTPYPCDYYGGPVKYTPDQWLIPSAGALNQWSLLWHEWIGYVVYKVMGYC